MAALSLWQHLPPPTTSKSNPSTHFPHNRLCLRLFKNRSTSTHLLHHNNNHHPKPTTICCYSNEAPNGKKPEDDDNSATGIQLYSRIERLITETAKQSQDGWGASRDWTEIQLMEMRFMYFDQEKEGEAILYGCMGAQAKKKVATSVVHFIGGVFVGAAPQLTYRHFLERLSEKGILVIATPFSSDFDHFLIADEVQYKFDSCLRLLKDTVHDLPIFGIGHSLGSLVHLLIGSRYAIERNGNVLMSFNNREASVAVPLFSPVIVPAAQSFGPLLNQLMSSSTIRAGAEIAMKQLDNLNPPIMRQVRPLIEQLPPLYTDLVEGREEFTPKPEETRRLIKSYYGVSCNLLVRFNDDTMDETSTLAQVLSSESAISSLLDMLVQSLPGDHGFPLQQVIPEVPPTMANAVNQGSKLLTNLTAGTPWEAVAKEVGNTLGSDTSSLQAKITKDVDRLIDVITSWMASKSDPKLLQP